MTSHLDTSTFEQLLVQADVLAQQEDWQACLQVLSQAVMIEPAHAGAVSGQGTCLIQMGRPDEAIPYFQKAVTLEPGSVDAFNNLGIALSLAGRTPEAETIFLEATRIDPENAQSWKNLALIYLQTGRLTEGVQTLAAVIQRNRQDVEALFILAGCYEQGEDIDSARLLYTEVLKNQPDHTQARQALDRLSPAELTRIARPEHAAKLKALKGLRKVPPAPVASPPSPSAAVVQQVVFYGPAEAAIETRLGPVLWALAGSGIPVRASTRFDSADLKTPGVALFSRPHASADLMEGLEHWLTAGRRVVLDLDEDFHALPADHADYAQWGAGNPSGLQAFERLLRRVDLVTASSRILMERYQSVARRIELLPYAWNRSNTWWDKAAPRRNTLNLGVIATHVRPAEAEKIVQDVGRVLKEVPEALLVIGIDLNLYNVFTRIPEDRKLFIPGGHLEDYPFLLSNLDVLLLPFDEEAFNQARSDLPLLEAGARRIPWIAPALPAFREWGAGGILVEKPADWYLAIKKLAESPALRKEYGEAGRGKADSRDASQIARQWLAALNLV